MAHGVEDYFKPEANCGANYKVKDIRPEHVDELMILIWKAAEIEDCGPSDVMTRGGDDDPGYPLKEKLVKNRKKGIVVKLKNIFLELLITKDDTALRAENDKNQLDAEDLLAASSAAIREHNERDDKADGNEVMKCMKSAFQGLNLAPNLD